MRACQPKDLKGREWRSMWERGRERDRERVREHMHQGENERERESALWLLLLYVFASTWACPVQIGLRLECCLFYLKSSLTLVLGPALVLLSWALPFLVF